MPVIVYFIFLIFWKIFPPFVFSSGMCISVGALGKGFYVTPDFEQAIFRAEADAAGHITVWVMLFNTGKILLDRKLYRFIKKWLFKTFFILDKTWENSSLVSSSCKRSL